MIVNNLNFSVMNKLFLWISFLMISFCNGQVATNKVTLSEYQNISIGGITLNDINNSQGSIQLLSQNFENLSFEEINFPDKYRQLSSEHISMEFQYNPRILEYQIADLKILSPALTVNIFGRTIKLGDSVDLLTTGAPLEVNNHKSIIYQVDDENSDPLIDESNYFIIGFDSGSRRITSIQWLIMT